MVRDTSLLAYMELQPDLSHRQMIVYEIIKLYNGLTDTEIANKLGFSDPNKVRPRRKELYDLGLVRAVGKRQCSITKRLAYLWGV